VNHSIKNSRNKLVDSGPARAGNIADLSITVEDSNQSMFTHSTSPPHYLNSSMKKKQGNF
jgi:hypothetical protein